MRFGFYLPHSGPTAQPDALAEIARRGDQLGFHCLVTPDHIVEPTVIKSPYPYTVGGEFGGTPRDEGVWPEQVTLLAFLAGITQKIRLVTSVMVVPYRNPILTAKMLATLDVLSKGRLIVGVGVGWLEEEFVALDAPPFAQRGTVTNEYIQAFKELWTSENPTLRGPVLPLFQSHFLAQTGAKASSTHLGRRTQPRALRRTAELGDAWHPVGAIPAAPMEPEELSGYLATLRRYAERAGRDPGNIEVAMKAPLNDTALTPAGHHRRFSGTPEEVLQDVGTYSDLE